MPVSCCLSCHSYTGLSFRMFCHEFGDRQRCSHGSAARRLLVLSLLWLGLATQSLKGGTTNLHWRWSNPLPFGNNITALAFSSTNLPYIAACERGQLYSSSDLTTWQRHDTGTRRALRAAVYFGDRLIVTGESGLVLSGWNADELGLVDLGTDNWLEGLGVSTSLVVAVGDNGAIYTSPDGVTWTPRSSGSNNWLRSVTYSSSEGLFVTVGEAGSIVTSPNGVTWTKRTSGTTAHLNRVVWTGLVFIALGESGVVLTSANGTSNWRTVSTGTTSHLTGGAVDNLRQTAAVGAGVVLIDTTLGRGQNWNNEVDPNRISPPPAATYYSAVWDGSQFVLGGRTGLLVTGRRSGFSYNWSALTNPTRSWLWDITQATAYGTNISASLTNGNVVLSTNRTTNTFYSAVGQGAALLQSENGIGWLTALAPANATDVVYLGVAGNEQLLVAVGSGGAIAISQPEYQPFITTNRFTNGAVVTQVVLTNDINTLGLAWGASTSKVTSDLQGVCISDGLVVVSGANGTLLTSLDAKTWTPRTSPRSTFLSSLAHSSRGFVGVGDLGTLLHSTDGLQWTDHSMATTNWIYRVRWLGDRFVAVGQNGLLLTSADGKSWDPQTSGVTAWLNDVIRVDGTFYAVGTQGTVLASPDTLNWGPVDSITGKSLYGLSVRNGQLIAVGAEGVILRAQAGAFPSAVKFLDHPKKADDSLFLFSGVPDQIFRLDRSTNLTDWILGPEIKITDAEGVLLYLDATTNALDRQFFRTAPAD